MCCRGMPSLSSSDNANMWRKCLCVLNPRMAQLISCVSVNGWTGVAVSARCVLFGAPVPCADHTPGRGNGRPECVDLQHSSATMPYTGLVLVLVALAATAFATHKLVQRTASLRCQWFLHLATLPLSSLCALKLQISTVLQIMMSWRS